MYPQQQPHEDAYGGGNAYGQYAPTVADASVDARAKFITRTYAHLIGAIMAFVGLITLYFVTGLSDMMASVLFMGGSMGWLVVLGAFIVVSMIAQKWAHSGGSQKMQYAGLALYVVLESVIFVPLITIVMMVAAEQGGSGLEILGEAGILTVVMFGALSAVVFVTRKNFSFLRGALIFGGIAAMLFIVASACMDFDLGLMFSWAMVAFAAISILYNTANVLHEYDTNQHVAAALNLFASFALLLWYVIRIVLASRD